MAGQPGRLALTVMLVALTGCQDAPPPADSVPPLILDFAPCVDSEARGGPAPGLHSAADTTTVKGGGKLDHRGGGKLDHLAAGRSS